MGMKSRCRGWSFHHLSTSHSGVRVMNDITDADMVTYIKHISGDGIRWSANPLVLRVARHQDVLRLSSG